MQKYVIEHFVEKYRVGNYEKDSTRDVLYHREEAMDFIDKYGEKDTFILTMFHNYEVTKEDVLYLLEKIDNAIIEHYHSYFDGKSLLKVII